MTKILVAEDEPDIRELVSLSLQFAGFEVVTVNNGSELLDRAPDVMPDMILTDVRMPRMTGYEACRELKGNPKTAGIPIVFLSAKGQEEEVKAGLAAGGEAYILKPFAPDQLARRVKELLDEHEKSQKAGPPGKDGRRVEAASKPASPQSMMQHQIQASTILKDPKKGTRPLGPPDERKVEPSPSAPPPPTPSKP